MLPVRGKTWRQHRCAPRGHKKIKIFRSSFCIRHKWCSRGKTRQHLGSVNTSVMLPPPCVLVLPAPNVVRPTLNEDRNVHCTQSYSPTNLAWTGTPAMQTKGGVTLVNSLRQLAMIWCCAKNHSSVTARCERFFAIFAVLQRVGSFWKRFKSVTCLQIRAKNMRCESALQVGVASWPV